jgi:Holliday junction resolvase RusA-like endonuclease
VKLEVKFYVKKKNRDIDNMLKITLDSMNKIVYVDDKQVHCINAVKVVSTTEKTIVTVSDISKIEFS